MTPLSMCAGLRITELNHNSTDFNLLLIMKTFLINFTGDLWSLHRKKPLGAKLIGVCTHQIVYLFSSHIFKKISFQYLWNLTMMGPGTKLEQIGNKWLYHTHNLPGWLWEDDGVGCRESKHQIGGGRSLVLGRWDPFLHGPQMMVCSALPFLWFTWSQDSTNLLFIIWNHHSCTCLLSVPSTILHYVYPSTWNLPAGWWPFINSCLRNVK